MNREWENLDQAVRSLIASLVGLITNSFTGYKVQSGDIFFAISQEGMTLARWVSRFIARQRVDVNLLQYCNISWDGDAVHFQDSQDREMLIARGRSVILILTENEIKSFSERKKCSMCRMAKELGASQFVVVSPGKLELIRNWERGTVECKDAKQSCE